MKKEMDRNKMESLEMEKSNKEVEEENREMILDAIKIMLRKGVPIDDIIHITGKGVEEIKKIEKSMID